MEIENFTYLNSEILENLTIQDKKYIEISKELAIAVKEKKLGILEVIRKLEYLLTNKSFSKRELGVHILSETLYSIDLNTSSTTLNTEQLVVLCSYFSEKLRDHHQVATAALKGVHALVNSLNVPGASIIQLVSTIFNHITCQQQLQLDRFLIFQIYETVLKKHTKEVDTMGIDFVYGVISSIDGERDPKNLIYLFNWLQLFLKTVKLGHLTEEMFEVLACYFPVDFKAPPSDKNKITREDLADGLCQCLTCIPDFGQHGIPLALEKLDSALKIAKEDSLDVLKNGCNNYDTSIYYQRSVEIWSQIQKEIFSTTDNDFKQKCLETLREMIKKLSLGEPDQFQAILNDISDNLKGNLLPDSKLFPQSSQILISVAQACDKSSLIIAKKVVPLLENTFKITKKPEHKSLIFKTLIAFVKAVTNNSHNIDLSSIEEISSIPKLCVEAAVDQDDGVRIEGFNGFTETLQYIPFNVREFFLNLLHKEITHSSKEIVKNAVFNSLMKMAEIYPQEVQVLLTSTGKICEVNSLNIYLESLTNLLKVPFFEGYVIDTIVSYALDDVSCSEIALRHLNTILNKSKEIDHFLVKNNFIVKLTDFLLNLENPDNSKTDFLNNVNSVLKNIVKNQESILQKEIYVSESRKSFKSETLYVAVLSGLIVPMKKGVFEDYEKIQFLLECCLNSSDVFVRDISLEVLANVLNKIDIEEVLEENLNKVKVACDSCSNIKTKIRVLSWITKSLVTRNHPNAWHWTDKLLNCLDENIEAAKGFKIIMDESNSALSKQYHCQIMPLYKQKFFVYVTNKITENYQSEKLEYFSVLGYLLKNVTKQAILGQFQKILRLILLSLEKCTEPNILQIILERITDFVTSGESVIENNFEDIFLRVLNLTSFDGSMEVRIAAIRCIQKFTRTYQVYKLLPYKQKVIQQLGICVDDRKRLVRREAMSCRALWYLLDAPE